MKNFIILFVFFYGLLAFADAEVEEGLTAKKIQVTVLLFTGGSLDVSIEDGATVKDLISEIQEKEERNSDQLLLQYNGKVFSDDNPSTLSDAGISDRSEVYLLKRH